MDLKLNDKTALVTGATAGIGLEIARALAAEGAKVFVTGRSQDKLDAALAEIGGKVEGVLADAATAEGAAAVLKAVPSVDILVNNIGIYEMKAFADIPDEDWLRLFDVNVMSGVRLARGYFPGMLERDWGRVIFISSESGLATPGEMVHYGMTKSAQLAVARGMAQATKGTGVTVNSILPGPTRSEGVGDFLKSVSTNPDGTPQEHEAEFFAKHRSSSLLQRMIEPQEVASLVAYVASPLSAATNGASLKVEGGLVTTIA
ncbi:SDR family NAD(P)-dependent oxidoreductase [Caulobacter sp. RHG1]|uniref:SDR family NAD(P)-dependent oxidoreductase n=1 Tax=Caulobacter sp. (strain RHG1) TaxID=2545762 RepID=UPI001554B4F2|nr:SDR family oxidoreductase [Caulobacter sp. RHG1]NQE60527.1 3-oxoacyl-(acyl-carrier protein) reductase [Caulobacter sp. RHG1]